MRYRVCGIKVLFREAFSGKTFVCCALIIQYTYIMKHMQYGRSALSCIYMTSALCTQVNMTPQSYIAAMDLPTVLYTYIT